VAKEFERSVFVNCPFDDDFRQLLLGISFTVTYFSYIPRLSLQRADSGESRIQKIVALIQSSKLGIHDISRMVASKNGEHFRMNMPFELGIDYGCKEFKGGKWSRKKILVLDKEPYRFQKAISDLSGSDIKNHNDEVFSVVKAVRDWLVTEELGRGDSAGKVWDRYNDFHAYLYDEVVETDGHDSIEEVQVSEIIHHMTNWCTSRDVIPQGPQPSAR
jgi:hypothetical protein